MILFRLLFLFYVARHVQLQESSFPATKQQLMSRNFVYNDTYRYDVIHHLTLNASTLQVMDFVEDSDELSRFPSRVHFYNIREADPLPSSISRGRVDDGLQPRLFVTATTPTGLAAWQLPVLPDTSHDADVAHTLCPLDVSQNSSESRPTLQLWTNSPGRLSLDVKLRRVPDFYLAMDRELVVNVSSGAPHVYYFSFEGQPSLLHHLNFNVTIPRSVIVMIDSDDDACAVISVQNDSYPVTDRVHELARGYRLTMTRRGGVTLTQAMFARGFYVVLVVQPTDQACIDPAASPVDLPRHRRKTFRLRVVATISYREYLLAALLSLAAILVFYVLVLLVTHLSLRCHGSRVLVSTEQEAALLDDDKSDTCEADAVDATSGGLPYQEACSLSASEQSLPPAPHSPAPLTLQQLCRQPAMQLWRRSQRYLWTLVTVAVVYALPVVQLLYTYQNMVFQTGEQDLCYYNFLCAHPLARLSDFNHVYSNVGYILLGLLFMAQVWFRQRAHRHDQNLGIPQHYGMLHGMGAALAMEGVLSACYHLCPNSMNFQFDSSFMYLIAVLSMVKLYQNRHPDINARAHHTFTLIAAVFAIGLIGILNPSLYFWVAFTMLHLLTCLMLTLKIYYVGRFKLEGAVMTRAWRRLRTVQRSSLVPQYRARFVLLAIANLANWALAAYGMYEHKRDLARHLLAILMGNTILYIIFYLVMKLVHRERIYFHTWVYVVGAHIAWFGALHLFLQSKTKWSMAPAQSRVHNAPCAVLGFYDTHDLWHLLSAAAMFLGFNLLLTVDDPLQGTPRDLIPVF